ncbi:MAG: POTRA domain-containing protein [Spirochaetaceae bacterium]|nr:POTRA domain-containing protein [Spirochaetaceae bacterium]
MKKPLLCLVALVMWVPLGVFGVSQNIELDRMIVEIDGVGSPRGLEEELGFVRGAVFTEGELASAVESVRESGRYSKAVYRLEPGRNGRIDVVVRFVVDPGYRPGPEEEIRIDRIEITGNLKTKDSVILSEFLFEAGERVDLVTIEESVQAVFNRELFFEVDWGLYDEPGGMVMELRVREKWTLFPIIYVVGDDGRTQLSLGLIDLNFAGAGFMLMGNYVGTFYPDDASQHNFSAVYNHQKLGRSRLGLFATGGYLSDISSVSKDGDPVGQFESESGYFMGWISYSLTSNWKTSFLMKYRNDVLSGDYDLTADTAGFGGRIEFDQVNLYDIRRQGFGARADVSRIFSFSGGLGDYIEAGAQAEYFDVFHKDLFNIITRLRVDYSSAEILPYQTNRLVHLRGGSGREYYSPLVLAASTEIGIAPLRENWMFLELVGVADLSWGDAGTGFMYRIGPGFRITFPPLAGLSLNVDYVFTERGETELYFGMFRFIDAR